MALRNVARWLALSASWIAAALPPAAVTRTVCAETGRAAIAWHAHAECPLALLPERPACCDHDGDPPAAPRDDDCCRKSPALTPAAPPDTGDDAPADVAALQLAPQPSLAAPMPPPAVRRAPPATGPPDHATRRHLRARRVEVLTI